MQLMTHEEFMALKGPVIYTEHLLEKKGATESYTTNSALMKRCDILGDTHFETVIIDFCIANVHRGFDVLIEPYTIKGYTLPHKLYRVFSREDVKIIIGELTSFLDAVIE